MMDRGNPNVLWPTHSLDRDVVRKVIMRGLTAFQRDVLYVIGGLGDPRGTAVKDSLEEYYEAEVYHGRLYPNLDTLVDRGLVDKGQKDDRTNEYSLTSEGVHLLEDRRRWEDASVDL